MRNDLRLQIQRCAGRPVARPSGRANDISVVLEQGSRFFEVEATTHTEQLPLGTQRALAIITKGAEVKTVTNGDGTFTHTVQFGTEA
jgi:hypothetical protein